MPELTRAQLALYAALAVVVLLLGARWVRASGSGEDSESLAFASDSHPAADDAALSFDGDGEDLVVHVAGEVRNPGVYRLPAGSRVNDAIERAGGATADGLADGINLAAPLADGQQVVIPGRSQAPAVVAGGAGSDGPISLGTASVEQLDTIEGIGPVTAAAILEFRDQRGGVASIDELDEISGIGPATMEALRARLQP